MFARKTAWRGFALLVASALVGFFPVIAGTARADDANPSGISDDASAALARMSKTLQAPKFAFQARTFRSYVGPNGELLHIAHTMKTVYRRPDRLAVDVTGDDGSIKLVYDGKAAVLYGAEQKQYVSLPVDGSIDSALNVVEESTGTDFPLADLLSDDPGESVLAGVTLGGQVDTAMIDGVRCDHFYFVQAPDMEFELWLEDNEQALPRRFVVTYRSVPGRPIFIAEISNWEFSIPAPDSEFEFQPPVGVAKVDLPSKAKSATPN